MKNFCCYICKLKCYVITYVELLQWFDKADSKMLASSTPKTSEVVPLLTGAIRERLILVRSHSVSNKTKLPIWHLLSLNCLLRMSVYRRHRGNPVVVICNR